MSNSNLEQSPGVDHYRAEFAERETRAAPWVDALRRDSIERFGELGFPTRRMEEWRYTNIAKVAAFPFSTSPGSKIDSLESLDLLDLGGSRLVFVDGRYAADLSTPIDDASHSFRSLANSSEQSSGALVHFGKLAECKDDGLTALNTALGVDAGIIELKKSCVLPHPLHVVFVTSCETSVPRASFPRICLLAESGSRGLVVQEHVSIGEGQAFSNAVMEVVVEDNASLQMVIVQREGDHVSHLHRQCVRQERSSRFALHTLSLGGKLLRNDLSVLLAAEGAECALDGLYLGVADQLIDNHTTVDHAVPHCSSSETYKGILAEKSRGVFRGRVIVRPGAQRTEASQQNRNLVLSNTAEVDTKPQLEIYADDVKCNHGSSIGQLDREALFFMRCRGLDPSHARALLTQGFAAEITQSIPHPELADWSGEVVRKRLQQLFARTGQP